MNKKEKLQARKKAYEIWAWSERKARPTRLAKETGLSAEEVRKYKKKDKWEERLIKDKEAGKFEKKIEDEMENIPYSENEKNEEIDKLQQILDNSGLTDQRKLFIMYYLQSYNVSWAAKQAGYSKISAHARGKTVLSDQRVIDTVNQIKQLMHENIYIKAHDIIDEYIKVAFADITNYVEFDNNKVELKPSSQVDGTIVTEVKQGRDGVTLKMADKMKALERLEKLFEILPDRKLELEQQKFELTKELSRKADDGESKVTIVNDIST